MINTITIGGLRGFGKERTISFAKPDGINEGSGLTFIVGANNTGKTTIAEALRAFNCVGQFQAPTFSSDKRNTRYNGGKVFLQLTNTDGTVFTIKTVDAGGSMTNLSTSGSASWKSQEIYVLNSRRSVPYEFPRHEQDKRSYLSNQLVARSSRSPYLEDFGARLNVMNKSENRALIDPLLKFILGMDLEWTIDETINRNCFLKIKTNGVEHISEGMGDGVWSIFTICDALYDLEDDQTLIIDEPELSLHPVYQKRVMKLLKRVAKKKQIIISTHSPYFVDAECLINGAILVRTHKDEEGNIEVFSLGDSKKVIQGLINDLNQPHIFGIEAKEIFFQEDNVIVTEGQDDVVFFQKAADELSVDLSGSFFGWGAGGATKIPHILEILQQLGYKKVSAIFDGDREDQYIRVKNLFPQYNCIIISQEDVRDKPAVDAKEAKIGLFERNGTIKEQNKEEVKKLFEGLNNYFRGAHDQL